MSRISKRLPQEIVNLNVLGTLQVGGGEFAVPSGTHFYADPAGSNTQGGRSWAEPKQTITAALALMSAGDILHLAPGEYDEEVTIARTLSKITIIGHGGRGACFNNPTGTNKTAFTNHADDVTFLNVGCDGAGTGGGMVNTGSRFRAYGCKFEGGANALILTLGTVAQEAAGTHGVGADCLIDDCEFAWSSAAGIKLVATDYGAVTQIFVRRCKFHNLSAAHFEESGGTASIRFRNLEISDCVFDDDEGGTPPTKFISLNDDNGNDGIVTRCSFPTTLAGGLNLVSTALHWVSNYMTGGISTGQPS